MADREEKKKGTSKALPFTKELQEMNRELYSACMVLKLVIIIYVIYYGYFDMWDT